MANKTYAQQAENPQAGKLSSHRNREILHIFNTFFHNESTGGILLLICAIIAVTLATVPGGEWFENLWTTHASVRIGEFSLDMSLRHWVNDALMAVFFFVVGLEIKREMLVGQLSSIKRSALPIVAALGGMLVPAGIYWACNAGHPESIQGWGIPMATDIAFAIGILSLLGNRVPASLKVFLTALAIVDDIGAIIVLAIFYPTHALHLEYLAYVAVIMSVLVIFNSAKLKNKYLYILPGIAMRGAGVSKISGASNRSIVELMKSPVLHCCKPLQKILVFLEQSKYLLRHCAIIVKERSLENIGSRSGQLEGCFHDKPVMRVLLDNAIVCFLFN